MTDNQPRHSIFADESEVYLMQRRLSTKKLPSESSTQSSSSLKREAAPQASQIAKAQTKFINATMGSEIMPDESLAPPLLRSPLYSADVMLMLIPHLIDSMPGRVPDDSWSWKSIELSDKEPMKREKRYWIVHHMLETEQNYLDDLKLITRFFRKTLLEEKIITEMSSKIAFEGMDEILETHTRFLNEIETAVLQGEQTPLSMTCINEMEKVYGKFIAGYSLSQREIREIGKQQDYERFATDIMVTPVSRLPRYVLLLKDLKKDTPVDHPDSKDLELALEEVQKLVKYIDNLKRQEEEKTNLFETYNSTTNCPVQLLNGRRRLVVQYDVTEIKERKTYRVAVCSDLIMVTLAERRKKPERVDSKDKPYKFVCWLDLKECKIEDSVPGEIQVLRVNHYPSGEQNSLTRFELDTPAHFKTNGSVWLFKVEDPGEYRKMIGAVQSCQLGLES
ncbi:hypothetical protein HK096_006061 [Nowakowskiella sp. JEL0078]|nr:hypothetical protein HK096_006061 [Nowakowskiella sp. JEL0078]